MPALQLSLPVTSIIVDDEERDTNSDCGCEREDTNISDCHSNDISSPPATVTTMLSKGSACCSLLC